MNREIFVPDGSSIEKAFARTSHLAIAAHHDDVEIMAASGIMDCFRQQNRWFSAAVVTDGSGSPRSGSYRKMSDAQMMDTRAIEQRKAAVVGEYSLVVQMGYESREARNSKSLVAEDIADLLLLARPGLLFVHNPADRHDTHVAVLLRTLEALAMLDTRDRPPVVLACEVWRSLDWLSSPGRRLLDTGANPALAKALLGVFDSQISGGKAYDRATTGRRIANATFEESHSVDAIKAGTLALDLSAFVDKLRKGEKPPAIKKRLSNHMKTVIADFSSDVMERIWKS